MHLLRAEMRAKRPRNAALEFARAFTYLVAKEGLRMGKRRTLDARKFEKWARATIRSAGGDPDRIGEAVGKRLHWLLYDQRRVWAQDKEFCVQRGKAFARRHRVLIAEQVLTGEAEPWGLGLISDEELAAKVIEVLEPAVVKQVVRLYREEKKRRRPCRPSRSLPSGRGRRSRS